MIERLSTRSPSARTAGQIFELISASRSPVLLLTATPIQNNLSELWALVRFVDPTGTLLGDLRTFRDTFCDREERDMAEGQSHELRRRIKKFRDDRGMPLFFHIEEEIAGKLEHYYLGRETIRFDEDKLAQIRLAYYQDARYKAKVGNDVTLQINQTFARQLPLFAEWNAAQDCHDHELNGDADDC